MIKGNIGVVAIELTLMEGDGGMFQFREGLVHIEIGVDNSWEDVVTIFLHEMFEGTIHMNNCGFQRESRTRDDEYSFHFEHIEWTRICDEVGPCIARMLPLIAADYNEIHGLRGKKKVGVV